MGLLSTSMSPVLANHFNGTNDPLDITTTFNSQPLFDLSQISSTRTASSTEQHKPQLLSYQFSSGSSVPAVQQCFDQHYADGASPATCTSRCPSAVLGDGTLETWACAQGARHPPCEQCDDGDTVAATAARRRPARVQHAAARRFVERHRRPRGPRGVRRRNAVNGDGCDRNCTKSAAGKASSRRASSATTATRSAATAAPRPASARARSATSTP